MKELNILKNNEVNLIQKKKQHIKFINKKIHYKRIEENLLQKDIQTRIEKIKNQIETNLCSFVPNACWNRKQHKVFLPYVDGFDESQIPTKARPIQMNAQLLEYRKEEIKDLLNKNLIRKSQSPWSCATFYVKKPLEIEKGAPILVINYKPLNKVLKWIRNPIPNKRDLIVRLYNASIFSKFDIKFGFRQIQLHEHDKYKTAFTIPFGHCEWNVMPFGLENASSEFQNIMHNIFNPYTNFSLIYIDDILIFSNSIEHRFKHLEIFQKNC